MPCFDIDLIDNYRCSGIASMYVVKPVIVLAKNDMIGLVGS